MNLKTFGSVLLVLTVTRCLAAEQKKATTTAEPEEQQKTYEDTRKELCDLFKAKGMKEKFDKCYDDNSPKMIKDIDQKCSKVIGITKLTSYKTLTTKFCYADGAKEVFEKFEKCCDDTAEKQGLDEEKENELMKPVLVRSSSFLLAFGDGVTLTIARS